LHAACLFGVINLPVVEYLVEHGAEIAAKNNAGDTALHKACRAFFLDNLPVVEYLVEHGAEIAAKNNVGDTALHKACDSMCETFPTVEYLVARGAEIVAKNNAGRTPFDLAISGNKTVLLQHYQEQHCRLCGWCSLHSVLLTATYSEQVHAAGTRVVATLPIGTLQMSQLLELLAYCISQNSLAIRKLFNNELALHIACRTHAPMQVLRFLVGQDPLTLNVCDGAGSLPIHVACRAGAHLETLQFLVENGGAGTLGTRDHNGALPLHLLCKVRPSVEAIKYMIRSDLRSVSIKMPNGDLPVMIAVKSKASESVILELSLVNPEGFECLRDFYRPATRELFVAMQAKLSALHKEP